MATAISNTVGQLGGLVIRGTAGHSADGGQAHEIALPSGTAGTLTDRTDDDTGEATLESGHGLQTNDIVAVFWSGGSRYGITAAVAGDVITIAAGVGDNLPAMSTAVVVTQMVDITGLFESDDLQAIVAGCDQRCHLSFIGSAGSPLLDVGLPAGEPWDWAADRGITNPLGGASVGVAATGRAFGVYNGSSTTAATLKIGIVLDTTP